MPRIEDTRKQDTEGFGLDIRPLIAPVSPFAWYAQQLRDADYPDAKAVQQAKELLDWCEYLARALPDLRTADPVLAAAACKAACNAPDRAFLTRVCAELDRVIQASMAPTGPAAAPSDPPA